MIDRNSGTSSELSDSEVLQSPDLSAVEYFSFDDERSKQAAHLLTQLTELLSTTLETKYESYDEENQKRMQIRDACIANMAKCRNSKFFHTLEEKFQNHELFTANEYILFALLTDNVNKLDPWLLRQSLQNCSTPFDSHIEALIAVREWQEAAGAEARDAARIKMRSALNTRSFDYYLNLQGAKLTGADLRFTDFRFTNFAHAEMAFSSMGDTGLNYCNLDYANLSYVNQPATRGISIGPEIFYSTARHANFNGVQFSRPHWQSTDFDSASFKNASLQRGNFKNSSFDNAEFDGSYVKLDVIPNKSFCSFKNSHLANAVVVAYDYKNIDIAEAHFIDNTDFDSGLDKLHNKNLRLIRHPGMDANTFAEKYRHRQSLQAEIVVNHVNRIGLTNEQIKNLLEDAKTHPMFEPYSTFETIVNDVGIIVHTVDSRLFGEHKYVPTYQTKGYDILDAAYEKAKEAAARETRPAMSA